MKPLREMDLDVSSWAEWFWPLVDRGPTDACWPYMGSRNASGYGIFSYNRKNLAAHRIAYALSHGGVTPADLIVRHRCDNPPCVNPAHLELGTIADNLRDWRERGDGPPGTRDPLNALRATERQLKILRLLAEPVAQGLPLPTIRGLCAATGIGSTNGMNDHLKALERKGLLQRVGNKRVPTDLGWTAVGLSPLTRRSA